MKQILFRFLQGMLIGTGAILPGVSGGMLCLLFGMYEPVMELLAAPMNAFRRHRRLFVPLFLGGAAGFLVLAQLVGWAFARDPAAAVCLFLGLTAGSLPPIALEAFESSADRRFFPAGFFGMIALMAAALCAPRIEPNPFWYLLGGAVWGLSLVLPGLSSSTLLIFLGLYQPMTAGIAALDLTCILPLGAGILLTVLPLARRISRLLQTRRSALMSVILGAVCASCLMILPVEYKSAFHALVCLLCALAGFTSALILEMMGRNAN